MDKSTQLGPLDELDALLDAEREHLLTGRLTALADLLASKEILIERVLEMGSLATSQGTAIQTKLARNQLLLDRAAQGIRTVAARLAALRQVRERLDIYNAQGKRSSVPAPVAAKVERRA